MKGVWMAYLGISYFVKEMKYNATSEGILPHCKSLALRRVTQSHSHLRCTNSSINLCTLVVWLPYHTVGQLYIAMQVWKSIQKSQGTLVNCSRHSQCTLLWLSKERGTKVIPDLSWTVEHNIIHFYTPPDVVVLLYFGLFGNNWEKKTCFLWWFF